MCLHHQLIVSSIALINIASVWNCMGMTKYRKGPQESTVQDRNCKLRWSRPTWAPLNTAETAMETKHAAGPRRKSELTGSQSVRQGRLRHLWTWKLFFVPVTRNVASPSLTGRHYQSSVRLAVFCLINEGVAGTKQSTSTDGNLIAVSYTHLTLPTIYSV